MRRRKEETHERDAALLYLASLALTEPDDRTLILSAAETSGPMGRQLRIFRNASRLMTGWGYSVSDSLRHAARAESGPFREMAEKLSRAANIGLRLSGVVRNEYEKSREYFRTNFERSMDRVKTIGDVQATLMSSSSFLIISLSVMSIVFSGVDSRLVVFGVVAALFTVFVLLSYYASRVSGMDSLTGPSGYVEWWLWLSDRASRILFAFCLVFSPLMIFLAGPDAAGWAMLLAGLSVSVFAGFVAWRMRRISRIDRELPFLMKGMGESLSTLQVVEKAVSSLLINDYGELTKHLRSLHLRIRCGLSIPVAFRQFVRETCSRLVYESCGILVEALDKGAPMSELGRLLYDYLNDRLSMRRRREQVSSYIKGILMPTAVTVAAVMGLMSSLFIMLYMYSSMASQILMLTPSITPGELSSLLLCLILVNSAGSGIAIHIAERKSWTHLLLYFGIILTISMTSYLFMKHVSYSLFGSLTSYTEAIKEAVG